MSIFFTDSFSYLKCRSEMLHSLSQLAFACNSLRTSPPPAIASAQAKQVSKLKVYGWGKMTSLKYNQNEGG